VRRILIFIALATAVVMAAVAVFVLATLPPRAMHPAAAGAMPQLHFGALSSGESRISRETRSPVFFCESPLPALRRLGGFHDDALYRPIDGAVLADDVTTSSGRRGFVRVFVDRDERGTPRRDDRGRVTAHLAGGTSGQGSHVMSALATADALAVIPEEHHTLASGAEVELWWLDRA